MQIAEEIAADLVSLLHQGASADEFALRLAAAEAAPESPAKAALVERVRMAMAVRNRLELLQQREQGLLAVMESAQDLSSRLDLDELLRTIVRRARVLLGADLAWLSILDAEAGVFRVVVTEGSQAPATMAMVVGRDRGVVSVVMATRQPFTTPDYLHDQRFNHDARLDTAFRELPFSADDLTSPAALLNAMRGAEVTTGGSRQLTGRLMSVTEETVRLPGNDGATTTRHRVTLMTGEGLRQLAAHGIEIGCHSRNHRAMPTLDEASLADETKGAAADLERAGLPKPRAFAYPYGERDGRSERAVEAAGFAIAFGLRRARVTRRSNPFDIPRVEILARDRGWRFRLKTTFPRLAGAIR